MHLELETWCNYSYYTLITLLRYILHSNLYERVIACNSAVMCLSIQEPVVETGLGVLI